MGTTTTERFEAEYSDLFKFKVGDTVVLRGDLERFKATLQVNGGAMDRAKRFSSIAVNPPLAFTVTTQFLERCHGGFQRHYGLSPKCAETGTYTIEDTLAPTSAVFDVLSAAEETEDRDNPEG